MKLINLPALFGLILLAAANVFATAQYPDKIIYNGKQ